MISHLGPLVQFKVRDPRPAGTPERRMSRAYAQTDNMRPADGDLTVSSELEIKLYGGFEILRRT
jgi:hypothetical protein